MTEHILNSPDKLHIGIVVNQHYRPESGGGYSYYNILLKAINEYDFPGEINITNVIIYDEVRPLADLKKPCLYIKSEHKSKVKKYVNSRLLKRLGLDYIKQNFIGNYVFSLARHKSDLRIERLLKDHKIDILYNLNPVNKVLNFPFIMTHWDVGHRSTYPFPFLAMHGIYETRENYYNYVLNKALFIVCESNAGANELMSYYKFYKNKIKVLPTFGGLILQAKGDEDAHNRVLEKFGLVKEQFFMYPAQFWPHKNQYNLVKAFYEFQLNPDHKDIKLILCGSDKGNMEYIWEVVKSFSLQKKIIFTGFVREDELNSLYGNAIAMVMTTFLGPTNLPLIEAASLKCPVICSDLEGHREILGDTALYIDPRDSSGIAFCMNKMINYEFRAKLAENAYTRIKKSPFRIENTMTVLKDLFLEAVSVRRTWGA